MNRSVSIVLALLSLAPGLARAQASSGDPTVDVPSPDPRGFVPESSAAPRARPAPTPPFLLPNRARQTVARVEDVLRELRSVRRDIVRTERVRMNDGLIVAGLPVLGVGAAGFVLSGIALADAQGWGSGFASLLLAPCFVASGILTIAGTVLAAIGLDNVSSYDRRRAEAAARRGPLLERQRQLEIQIDLMTVPGGAVATAGGSF